MKGYLLLEDGTLYTGRSFGFDDLSGGEVVFNTAMTGYQEILTDPSYEGQVVVMTYPLIGNYGINPRDIESRKIFASGFVVREYNGVYSNWQARQSLQSYLEKEKIVAIDDIDTRALTRKIRSQGSMRAVIGTESTGLEALKEKLKTVPSMNGQNLAMKVALNDKREWVENSKGERAIGTEHILAIDCGIKLNILRRLKDEGARVTVVPPSITANELEQLKPDGILISNGPGDPDAVKGLPEVLRGLIGKVPMFGICLGHQLLAHAIGAKTFKLKFGHHGANHPVRNEKTGRIEITSQNHGFAVDPESLIKLDGKQFGKVRITHIHLSDGTIEGFELPDMKVQAIQYHPEASPGPHDASYLFEEFLKCIRISLSK